MERLNEMIHREREDLLARIKQLSSQIRRKEMIIDQFIPGSIYKRIERRAEWREDENQWVLPKVEYTGNNIRNK